MPADRRCRLSFRGVVWEPRDIWIGIYWTRHDKSSPPGWDPTHTIYVCIIPLLPIVIDWYGDAR